MADRRGVLVAPLVTMALALAACQPADHGANGTAPSAAGAQPTRAAAAKPLPTPAAAVDLGRYAGHYPFDKVDGTSFLDDPAVTAAVTRLVPDDKVRAQVLGGGDGVGTPIAAQGGTLLAWSCQAHNCGDHNWTIEIAPDGGEAAVCYHDAATMHDRSRWYDAAGGAAMRDGACPSG